MSEIKNDDGAMPGSDRETIVANLLVDSIVKVWCEQNPNHTHTIGFLQSSIKDERDLGVKLLQKLASTTKLYLPELNRNIPNTDQLVSSDVIQSIKTDPDERLRRLSQEKGTTDGRLNLEYLDIMPDNIEKILEPKKTMEYLNEKLASITDDMLRLAEEHNQACEQENKHAEKLKKGDIITVREHWQVWSNYICECILGLFGFNRISSLDKLTAQYDEIVDMHLSLKQAVQEPDTEVSKQTFKTIKAWNPTQTIAQMLRKINSNYAKGPAMTPQANQQDRGTKSDNSVLPEEKLKRSSPDSTSGTGSV